MALGSWFLKYNRDSMKKNSCLDNKMKFIVDPAVAVEPTNDDFYVTKDKSLMYTKDTGDYSVYLAGNWRFELIVDSTTGVCQKVQSFLDQLNPINRSLDLPQAKKNNLVFVSFEKLSPFDGCHYYPFEDIVSWDSEKQILCIGNPDVYGEAVEFSRNTIAVVTNGNLKCIYLLLSNICNDVMFLNRCTDKS